MNHAMSPKNKDSMVLLLDKYVLLKGGGIQHPVPGKYEGKNEPILPAREISHAPMLANEILHTNLMLQR